MPEHSPIADVSTQVAASLRQIMPGVFANLPNQDKAMAKRIIGGAFQCLANDPQAMRIASRNPEKLQFQLIAAAQMGWTMGPTMSSDCHLLRFKDQIQCVPNYRGLIKSAYQGGVTSIQTGVVREGDIFEYEMGTNPRIRHVYAEDYREDAPITHAWATVHVGGSDIPVLEVMPKASIEKIRQASRGKNALAWSVWYEEQARKSVLKRALKKAPRSEYLAKAIAIDDSAETGKPVVDAEFDIMMEGGEDVHEVQRDRAAGARPGTSRDDNRRDDGEVQPRVQPPVQEPEDG
jgi:phage RecT family recombinase